MKLLVFFLVAFQGLVASAVIVPLTPSANVVADCTPTAKSGLVSLDLRPDFNLLGAQVPQRLTNIVTLLGGNSPNPKTNIFYQFAAPYDVTKKTILLSDSFYPKLSLDFVVHHFSSIAAQYNILQIHFRGSGCSPTPEGLSPLYFTHEMIAADIEIVRRRLHLGKINSLASGNGSFVMLTYALLFPDHVERIFLRDTASRAASLGESSDYFKLTLLPELITSDQRQRLQNLAIESPEAYTSILRFTSSAMQGGTPAQMGSILDQGLSVIGKNGSSVLGDYIDYIIGRTPAWNEAMTANECLLANESYDEIDYKSVLVTPYVYLRCAELQKTKPQALVEPLNFVGQMRGVQTPFYIYQSYWDTVAIRPLAEQLQAELFDSQIFIDRRIGRGEITTETLPCLTNLISFFFSGESQEKIALYVEQSCK